MDAPDGGSELLPPHLPEVRFHVSGWVFGSAFGLLTVEPDSLTFVPSPLTRFVLRFSGRLVHRRKNVVLVSAPLFLGSLSIALQADAPDDALTVSPLIGARVNVTHGNLGLWPWQRRRARRVLLQAGFDVEVRRRWFPPLWWRVY